MKAHAALLSVAVSFAMFGVLATASTPVSPRGEIGKPSTLSLDVHTASPRGLFVISSAAARYRFPVADEKGPLLTCIAPELDKNSETELFKNCVLAPGRTLDDVMHSFVQGIHEEQRLHAKEHSATEKNPDENAGGQNAQK